MLNYYYKDTIKDFINKSTIEIFGSVSISNQFDTTRLQNIAWREQVDILKQALLGLNGTIFFEFSIPRMGKRVDAIVLVNGIVFVVEFKVGEKEFHSYHIDQVWDYALDLKNFHKPSHKALLAPVLIATEAKRSFITIETTSHNDNIQCRR
jgi:hypothetical protein